MITHWNWKEVQMDLKVSPRSIKIYEKMMHAIYHMHQVNISTVWCKIYNTDDTKFYLLNLWWQYINTIQQFKSFSLTKQWIQYSVIYKLHDTYKEWHDMSCILQIYNANNEILLQSLIAKIRCRDTYLLMSYQL